MKRLDQLTTDDLIEAYFDELSQNDTLGDYAFLADESPTDDMLILKEEYEQLDRLKQAQARASQGDDERGDLINQSSYWQDKRVPIEIRARVWRSSSKSPRKPS